MKVYVHAEEFKKEPLQFISVCSPQRIKVKRHLVIFICPCCDLFHSGPWVEQTRAGVVAEGIVSVKLTSSVWGTAEVCVSVSFSVNRWGGMYPGWGFVCSLWCLPADFGGQRPLLSCPRKPLSLGLQCSRHWRASVERSATRRLSSGPQPRSPSSAAPIKRKVRPTWRAGQPQLRSRSGTQRERGPLRTREAEPARKTVCTEMENCHQGPERSIPLTCTFSTEKDKITQPMRGENGINTGTCWAPLILTIVFETIGLQVHPNFELRRLAVGNTLLR